MRLALPLFLLLAACGDERPLAPTPEQSKQIDEAEAMLDDLANEEGPAAEAADPPIGRNEGVD